MRLAYLKSEAYAERFDHRSGRWLVVTTEERRMTNMLRQARRGMLGECSTSRPTTGSM
jgi:hypothetical protein